MPKAKALADQALCRKTRNSSRRSWRDELSSSHREIRINYRNSLIIAEIDDCEVPEVNLDIYLTVIPSQQALETVVANKT